jgi:pimeloyl-ACP methyl ester carboxylesterase
MFKSKELPVAMSPTVRFEPAPARYEVPAGVDVEFGYLTVPEVRHAESGADRGRGIRLYVAISRGHEQHTGQRPDPVIFLNGGPGGHMGPILRWLDKPLLRDAFPSDRDVIYFDQRGTGWSEPGLFLPEADEEMVAAVLEGPSMDVRRERYVAAALRGRDRLLAEGVNLKAYSTPESAADVADLIRALGYERADLFGISYGTRLALAVMRDHPEVVRSVILDSTVPIQVSQFEEGITNLAAPFDLLFDRVAADTEANAAFPDLRRVFHTLRERLDANPDIISFDHPATAEPVRMPVTGELLTGVLHGLFYSTADIPSLPRLIWDFHNGDYSRVIELARHLLTPHSDDTPRGATGMYYCVNCCDDKPTPAIAPAIAEQAAAHPGMASVPLSEFHLGEQIIPLCQAWGAREPGPAEYAPVVSDIPTLILAGEYDPNTPARWGRLAGETLPNSTYVEFPAAGHGIIRAGACATQLLHAFITNPTASLDTSCVDAIGPPNFISDR